jgi:hypothetical protein
MSRRKIAFLLSALLPVVISSAAQAQQTLPNPVLYLMFTEPYTTAGGSFIRYRYDVLNRSVYPAAFFTPAPSLPPCGSNTNSARAWVDFFDARTNARLYGFCALGNPNDLGQIWFALPEGQIPPSYVYIEINDRQTGRRYRSNSADTVM